ncbi:MAG: hypothetical protein EBT36_10975 [Betaproteobacteria bacterium]|jgi:pheromone shutdown protein TraB|nr:hypothetical protein [Betaproteobacteria bacterium]NBQ79279.1 hypothetical protein [Betaproteobacteria bacterium]NBQ95891.1 hypothetical protein [Betaproteobacteria bacterium]NBT71892.1 hypothetical protein [Betaproteobacteria bacterium]NBT82272.1 hypothetical protein [Betaproteobacteria bacterium]
MYGDCARIALGAGKRRISLSQRSLSGAQRLLGAQFGIMAGADVDTQDDKVKVCNTWNVLIGP